MEIRKFVVSVQLFFVITLLTACTGSSGVKRPEPVSLQESPEVIEAIGTKSSEEKPAVTKTSEVEFRSKTPATFIWAVQADPDSLDPALAYATGSGAVIQNIYETLIFFNRQDPADFVPQLAEEVPSLQNGGISTDGLQYTFNIRSGVHFQDGAEMTPSDVAYSLQRGLLQGGTNSPQWLLTEPLFGFGVDDIALLVEIAQVFGLEALSQSFSAEQKAQLTGVFYDDRENLAMVDPDVLMAVCKRVKSAVVTDDQAGTVTFHLAQPWGPFLATLASTWGSILDQEWVVANGGWDGSCDTWQNFYAMIPEQDPINAIMNGTGPYQLESWRPGEEIAMVRNPDYWRSEPIWPGGPSGPAELERVLIKVLPDWGNCLAMLQAGDLDTADMPLGSTTQVAEHLVGEICEYNQAANDFAACQPSSSPSQPLRMYRDFPTVSKTSLLFNFDIQTEIEGDNFFIGSGQLDGDGIPTDFFSDVHVRKAFNYCFDRQRYIEDALGGEAIPAIGVSLPGMIGYEPDGAHYSYDLSKCEAELRASTWQSPDGKSLWDTGFYLQFVYASEGYTYQTIAGILAESLADVNQKFRVEPIGLPLPALVRYQRAGYLPLFRAPWLEDIHDPHNWFKPYLDGIYSNLQALPEVIRTDFATLIQKGVLETDPTRRQAIYQELNQQVYDAAVQIPLAIPTRRFIVQRWVQGWYANPIYPGLYFYALSKQ